jgi:enhancing lycopene biosynthesis protein 2
MLPGGFGVAKNFFTFAFDGVNARVNPTVEKAIRETHEAGKPLVALCIAPVLIAKVLGKGELTIGQDEGTRQAVEQMGATHKNTGHGEVVVDIKNKIVTNPCYMLDARISDIATGAENAVKAVLDLLK